MSIHKKLIEPMPPRWGRWRQYAGGRYEHRECKRCGKTQNREIESL